MHKLAELLIIGAGSGGIAAAKRAAITYGKKVTIIDPAYPGGRCLHAGCVPKKILLSASEILENIRNAHHYSISVGKPTYDWEFLRQKRAAYIKKESTDYDSQFKSLHINHIKGWARFVDNNNLEVSTPEGKQTLTSEHILITCGSRGLMPKSIEGIENCIDVDKFFALSSLPKSIFIIGGGYIGVEAAGVVNSFGVKTTIAMLEQRMCTGFDEEISRELMDIMAKKGVQIMTDSKIAKVEKVHDSKFLIHFKNRPTFECNAALCAAGAVANLEKMGLENTSIKLNRQGFIECDEYENTAVKGVYALGDANGKFMLTPVARTAAVKLVDRLFGENKSSKLEYENIPSVVFSHPPMGKIGMTEEEALSKYGVDNVKIYRKRFVNLFFAPADDKEPSLFKVITLRSTGKILGIHGLGKGIDEMIQGFAVAMKMGATMADFEKTVHIYPTASEEFVTMDYHFKD